MRFVALAISMVVGFAAGTATKRISLPPAPTAPSSHLFLLHRSTNANVVAYDAKVGNEGFELGDPIDVYWLMHVKDGAREELTGLEKRRAFGIEVRSAQRQEVVFHLVSIPDQPITVRLSPTPGAFMKIRGEEARLDSVFVSVADGSLIPSVRHVEVRGTSLDGARKLRERIVP